MRWDTQYGHSLMRWVTRYGHSIMRWVTQYNVSPRIHDPLNLEAETLNTTQERMQEMQARMARSSPDNKVTSPSTFL